MLRSPAVIGSAGALVGLLVGIFVGRAGSPDAHQDLAPATVEQRLAKRPGALDPSAAADAATSAEYRGFLGRRTPRGAKGFTRARIDRRPVVLLSGDHATLRFDIAPKDGSYALISVAALEGAKHAKVHMALDGKPLGESNLNPGWGIYVNEIPVGTLSEGTHELSFHKDASATNVGIESIAVAPVTPEVDLPMGIGAAGTMIDGFSSPSRDSVWSVGLRSTLGVVLSTAEGNYRLKVRGAAISKLAPLTVSVRVNGKDVGTGLFEKKLTRAEWAVPANTLQPGVNRIEFSYPHTATPAEYNPKSQDNRPLALRFHHVMLQPDQ